MLQFSLDQDKYSLQFCPCFPNQEAPKRESQWGEMVV